MGELAGSGLTIQEFAAHTDLSVRTVRFYHQLGVLQRPALQGRVGYYGQEHVDRVELIKTLQAKGYSLAAVADTVATQIPAILLGETGGVDPTTAVWDGFESSKITWRQIVHMLPQAAEDPAAVERLVALGLLVPGEDDRWTAPNPPLLRAGLILISRGVPLDTALDELESLRRELHVIAGRFARIAGEDILKVEQPAGRDREALVDDLLRQVWPAVLVAVGQVLTDATQTAVLERLGAGFTEPPANS